MPRTIADKGQSQGEQILLKGMAAHLTLQLIAQDDKFQPVDPND